MFKCCKKKSIGKQSYNIPRIEFIKDDFTEFEMEILELVNDFRRSKNLQMLEFNMKLANIALSHTNYMVEKGEANHDNFSIRNIQAIKYCNATWLGENVGYGFGTAQGFVNAWINSEGHRKILESDKAIFFAVSTLYNSKKRNFATLLLIN